MRYLISVGILSLLYSQVSYGEHYYRFWRGYKLPELSFETFLKEINENFIPATVDLGAGKGLLAYLPVITKAKNSPDEVALVVYKNKQTFRQIFSTNEGKNYGRMHWDYFNRQSSKSLVPQKFIGKVAVEKAYDLLLSKSNWQKSYPLYIYRKYTRGLNAATQKNIQKYFNSIQKNSKDFKINSHITLVGKKGLYEYILFESIQSLEDFKLAIKGTSVSLRAILDQNPPLRIGQGSNQQF